MKNLLKLASFAIMISLFGCNKIGDVPEILMPKPQPVAEFTAIAGDGAIALSWKCIDVEYTEGFELTYSPNTPATPIKLASNILTFNVPNLTNGTEYTFSIKAFNVDNESGLSTTTATPKKVLNPAKFLTFKFEKALNPDMALEEADRLDLVGTINEVDRTVTFAEQSAYVYFDNLIPTFTVEAGVSVKISSVAQQSGVTANDYTNAVSYILTKGEEQTLYTVTLAKSKYATIPDANFLAFLKADATLKFNDQEQLDITDASVTERTTQLDCDFSKTKTGETIKSLKGIEFFTKIVGCRIERNEITSLDLRKNVGYTAIVGGWNKLTSINISNCPVLNVLYLQGNKELTTMDFSKHPNVTRLYSYNTGIGELDVSKLTKLEKGRLRISVATAEASKSHLKKLFDAGVAKDVVQYYGGPGAEDEETLNQTYVLDLTGVQ